MNIDKKTIVAIVLVVLAVVVVVTRLKSGFAPSKPKAKNRVSKAAPKADLSTAKASRAAAMAEEASQRAKGYSSYIETLQESDLDFEAKRFRNPMTPLVSESDGKKSGRTGGALSLKTPVVGVTDALALGYTIEGIVWDEADPLALINNQVVGVGDRIDDETLIVEITPQKVRFTRKGREYFLEFREE